MPQISTDQSRRTVLKSLGGTAVATLGTALAGKAAEAQTTAPSGPPILMDGHVHITSRVYWEKIDPWKPQATGWDYARARAAGVNVVIENLGTYSYWGYNQTPKQMLRLVETFHRVADANKDKMEVALTSADARRIVASGRMAVFMGVESGWDHDGDLDVLGALYRLGLRSVQFSTQTGFNAYADSALSMLTSGQPPNHYKGINERGRALIKEMNRLGILIDIAHATEAAQAQIIEASAAPVVDSHDGLRAITGGPGLSDELLKKMAAKGGLIGIHAWAALLSKRYVAWMAANREKFAQVSKPFFDFGGYRPSFERQPGDRGEYAERLDAEAGQRFRAAFAPWRDDPEAAALVPTADEWAASIAHVIATVGADHVGIGLDMTGGRSNVPKDPGGYPELVAALNRLTTPENVRKVCGENWLRVLDKAKI
jgi:membrane dipeptidase